MRQSQNQQFLFHDAGDVVLGIEDKCLKVHQNNLMGPLVFFTILELPQPDLMESFDGCPLVLPHDTYRN